MDQHQIAAPRHVPRPEGPWDGVPQDLARLGTALVCTTWGEWLPALLTTPRLRQLLGRDWTRYRRTPGAEVRHRFAAARLLVKCTAAAALRIAPEAIDLAYQLGGRPYLRGFDQIELSLSHTGDLLAVAISRIGRIGVDVEPADRRLRLDLLQDQLCTPAEAAHLQRLPADQRRAHVLRLWTLKEAYTKALGQGMRLGFTEFGFSTGGHRLLAADGTAAARPQEWAFATHPVLGHRYLLSVACQDCGLDPDPDTCVHTMLDPGFWSTMTRPPAT